VARIELPGDAGELALRAIRRGGALGPWLGGALAGPVRPFRELDATARLRAAGAPVPRPLLAIAWRRGLLWHGAVGTVWIAGRNAADLLATRPDSEAVRPRLAAAGRAVRRFHDAGGRHPDLHVGNLLVVAGPEPEVHVIDLDGARAGAPPDPAARMAELMRLYRSLRKRALLGAIGGARGCATFLGAYTAGDRTLRRALLARLPAERRRVALHALRYPRTPD
jgi:3-deoxy-D-manno-octulosonic acid kinase